MSFGPEEDAGEYLPPSRTGTNRALLPGIFLIIVGVLNLLMAGGGGLVGFTFGQMPQADLQKAYDDFKADQRGDLKQIGVNSAEDLRSFYVRSGYGAGVIWAVD